MTLKRSDFSCCEPKQELRTRLTNSEYWCLDGRTPADQHRRVPVQASPPESITQCSGWLPKDNDKLNMDRHVLQTVPLTQRNTHQLRGEIYSPWGQAHSVKRGWFPWDAVGSCNANLWGERTDFCRKRKLAINLELTGLKSWYFRSMFCRWITGPTASTWTSPTWRATATTWSTSTATWRSHAARTSSSLSPSRSRTTRRTCARRRGTCATRHPGPSSSSSGLTSPTGSSCTTAVLLTPQTSSHLKSSTDTFSYYSTLDQEPPRSRSLRVGSAMACNIFYCWSITENQVRIVFRYKSFLRWCNHNQIVLCRRGTSAFVGSDNCMIAFTFWWKSCISRCSRQHNSGRTGHLVQREGRQRPTGPGGRPLHRRHQRAWIQSPAAPGAVVRHAQIWIRRLLPGIIRHSALAKSTVQSQSMVSP